MWMDKCQFFRSSEKIYEWIGLFRRLSRYLSVDQKNANFSIFYLFCKFPVWASKHWHSFRHWCDAPIKERVGLRELDRRTTLLEPIPISLQWWNINNPRISKRMEVNSECLRIPNFNCADKVDSNRYEWVRKIKSFWEYIILPHRWKINNRVSRFYVSLSLPKARG